MQSADHWKLWRLIACGCWGLVVVAAARVPAAEAQAGAMADDKSSETSRSEESQPSAVAWVNDDPIYSEVVDRGAHLRRTRPRVERMLGLLAHRYHARKSRYIGTRKARLQAAWSAALVNLNPIGRQLITQTT